MSGASHALLWDILDEHVKIALSPWEGRKGGGKTDNTRLSSAKRVERVNALVSLIEV